MIQYMIPHPMKALEALRKMYPDSSRRTLQHWLKAGRFHVDGRLITRENEELQMGQVLVSKGQCKSQLIPNLTVLYEDRYLIAIDKPIGLLSVPLDDGAKRHALGLLRDHFETDQIFAVHRIDRETSGCLLFAKGKASEEHLKELFERHDLKRIYFAIVEGRMQKKGGTWQSRLIELESLRVVESDQGKDAITHFSVLKYSPKYTYLQLTLETGRKHQIRVHCSAAGHPVLGDARYGASENPIRRMCLHACYLELIHPFTGKKLAINSLLPPAFKKIYSGFANENPCETERRCPNVTAIRASSNSMLNK